jgi:glycosyltransferase involved in cell wall biosynthesis
MWSTQGVERLVIANDARRGSATPLALVSVVMPNYNKEQFILLAIQSVLQQTFRDFELVIVDDGSTDNSLAIIKEVAKTDGRIKVLTNAANVGPSFTLNKAMNAATGQYICFIDSDDVFRPERLERMVDALKERPGYIAYTDIFLIDKDGEVIRNSYLGSMGSTPEGDAYAYALSEWVQGLATMMIPATATQEVGHFDESLSWGEDFDYVLRLTERYKVALVREPLYGYRRHASSMSALTSIKSKGEAYCRILESNLERNWGNLDERTKFRTIRRIQRTAKESHIRSKYLKWWINPTFLRVASKRLVGGRKGSVKPPSSAS